MKDRTLFGLIFLGLTVLGAFAYWWKDRERAYQYLPVERLAAELEANYRRSLDRNGYSILYRAVPPDTIVIEVQHYKDVNRRNLSDAIESAKEMVRGKAKYIYGIDYFRVETRVQTVEVPGALRRDGAGGGFAH